MNGSYEEGWNDIEDEGGHLSRTLKSPGLWRKAGEPPKLYQTQRRIRRSEIQGE